MLIIIFVQRSEGQTFLITVTILFSFSFKCASNSVQCMLVYTLTKVGNIISINVIL